MSSSLLAMVHTGWSLSRHLASRLPHGLKCSAAAATFTNDVVAHIMASRQLPETVTRTLRGTVYGSKRTHI